MSKIVVKPTLKNLRTNEKIMSLNSRGGAFRVELRY